ncbi:MAG: hypothetical protein FWH44_05515, partial [Methanomassiliicoccaceae archaeon]|nr:hypothetical protein [Methanomassiliicoccaceae archaeon]
PAGTGRNETICNMISDAVYSGRTVLFVSENDASLASVKERMGEAGIGRMCLHLNSGNADKKRVLDHFRNVTDSACRSYVDGYRSVSDDIDKMYNDLSSTLLSLHRMTNSGVSIFDVMMRYNNVRDKKAEIIEFPEKLIVSAVPGSTEKWEGMVGDLITAARTLGHPSEHPLSDTGITEFNPETADAVTNALNEWIGAAEDAEESLMSLLSSVELNDTADADGLAGSLLDLGAIPKDIAGSASATRTSEMIHELSEAVTSSFGVFVEMSGRLGMNTIEDGIRIAEEHHDRMRSALDGLIDIRIPDADTGLIEKYANDILAVKERMLASLTLLKEARKEWKDPALSLDTRDLMRRWKEIAGKRLFSGGAKKAFVKELSEYMKNGDATFDSLPSYVRSVENYISAMNEIKRSLSSLDVSDSTYGSLADSVRSLRKTYEITRSKLNALKEHGDADKICEIFSCGPEVEKNASRYIAARKELSSKRRSVEDLLITNISKITDNDTIEEWKALAEKWAGNMNRAEEITAWNKCRKALADEGLECVANAYVNGMDHDTVMPSFIVSLNKYLMDSYISREPSLSKFDRTAFEENAARFREMSGTFAEMSRAELKAVAASRVYDVISEERPEIVSLKNMIATAGRGITIRSLLSEIKGMMSAVCPCMMMSPSSVSRYLDHNVSFDLVIIDSEQMMTHRAVDLMTRGKEVVIAGDIMRPPGVTASNAEKDDLMNDCLSVQMPVLGLEWNYRPEKLTEFTNSYFYGTRMRTFPPAIKEGPRIAVTYSDGTYDRTSKRNDTEAEAVVRYVMDRLKEGKGRSIGVVTFSEAQKELINDVLGSELARHPHSGSVITDTGDGIFVTDAGSLRSRDRDTIVMSLLIGKDPSGRLTTDLSPFSRADGEKVLKDAVSCANRNVMVFSSLRPDDLADNETNGIKALRSLLEYTEKGMPEKEKKKNELRAMISKAVAAKGYEVHENVGLSDAAVDIGVVDPEYKDRYILGILLDNGAFMMSDAADTEFVLKNMLEERGWALHHVWTTDWMNGREKETERIVSEIKKRLNEKDRWTPRMKEQKKADIKIITKVSASGTASRPAPRIRCVYKKADLEEKTVSLEALFSNSSRSMIERDIIKVIETESPVADTAVAQRLADAYGLRISPKLLDHLTAMIANVNAYSTITPWNSRILWKEMQSDHDSYRVPAEGDTRNVKEIAAEEITNAIIDIITAEPDILADDLIASVASLFGAGDIDSAGNIIAKCIDIAIEKKMIKRNSNGNVSLYIV